MEDKLLKVPTPEKKAHYQTFLPRIKMLCAKGLEPKEKLKNVIANLHNGMEFHWTGLYFARNGQLFLGPYYGNHREAREPENSGICHTALNEERMVKLEDVEEFPGFVSMGQPNLAEIILPGFKNGEIVFLLRVNKTGPDNFDRMDERYLSQIVQEMERCF